MKHIKDFIAMSVATFFLLIAAGSASQKSVVFDIDLQSVTIPTDRTNTFSEAKIIKVDNNSFFSDDKIAIKWSFNSSNADFVLKNLSNHTIELNWDDVTYVNYDGCAYRTIHSGVKLVDKNQSMTSILIPSGSSLSDNLTPTENISYVDGRFGGWKIQPLIPAYYTKDEEFSSVASIYVGKTIGFLFPIVIDGVRNDYYFLFKIGNPIIQKSDDNNKKVSQSSEQNVALFQQDVVTDKSATEFISKEELDNQLNKVRKLKNIYQYTNTQHYKAFLEIEKLASQNPTKENAENLHAAAKFLSRIQGGQIDYSAMENELQSASDIEAVEIFLKYCKSL